VPQGHVSLCRGCVPWSQWAEGAWAVPPPWYLMGRKTLKVTPSGHEERDRPCASHTRGQGALTEVGLRAHLHPHLQRTASCTRWTRRSPSMNGWTRPVSPEWTMVSVAVCDTDCVWRRLYKSDCVIVVVCVTGWVWPWLCVSVSSYHCG
jgi:hypothetical protein